ncbi:TPA: recombination protein RecR [Candidatus Dependentiae bacterium]|nr:MAG: Recombination protein RecR [candidate division TM6 bacterium GW2011_GWE2_31_21]KKP53139.1 MAG: Recombination protein RecR [candidate division TM6 bacterium GW2011_GWF2_33_332]HBS47958.1 recombination protein RecR [Candidatus Dependentiae bacterium]HBZ73438.1 recombination protein RecR [Candidatus Dependentiae bacterium]
MLKGLPSLERLVRSLQNIPYLASKNVYRVAMHLMESNEKDLERFCNLILDAKHKVKKCQNCFNWCEDGNLCLICAATKRDKDMICVVESWHELAAIEKAGGYNGVYHVLGGVLSPLEGIGPSDLTIDFLVKRILQSNITELILATNPTPEGEATANYIASKLQVSNLKISRLASGVPIGSNLENMDRVTIYKALSCRRPF